MGNVMKADASVGVAYADADLGSEQTSLWLTVDIMFPADSIAANTADSDGISFAILSTAAGAVAQLFGFSFDDVSPGWSSAIGNNIPDPPVPDVFQTYEFHYVKAGTCEFYVGGSLLFSGTDTSGASGVRHIRIGEPTFTFGVPGTVYYFDNVKIGTTRGAGGLFSDDFESGNLDAWTFSNGDVSVVNDPFGPPVTPTMNPGRRVGIAFDDGPREPNPTWTYLDDETVFPSSFVAGYDIHVGRQTLLSQTDTGIATVYVNDRAGLFDMRNDASPYQGKLSGKQIILQLWNPVTAVWERQFRGIVDRYSYEIDPATDANGEPINASIQLECVDMFDYLNGFELTPGLAGQVPPPAGMEDGVWYAPTAGSVQDRIIEILTDAGIDSSMYLVAQGNVRVVGVKYDPGDSALAALRDAADAEFPFISNIYINRYGLFQFRGRYSRFSPVEVAQEPGSDWDFNCWGVGDGVAIAAGPFYNPVTEEWQERAQMRVLAFDRDRGSIINRAICWPQGSREEPFPAADMPNQVYVSVTSSDTYGPHSAPPMSDLLTADDGLTSGFANAAQECFHFAKLLVKNQAFPREAITALQIKAMRPTDSRAEVTWATICGADISHVLNVAGGYPGGTGFDGGSPEDDYYIEGRSLTVRPLNPEFDYVEVDYEVSPAVWSMDTHGVFPPLSGDAPVMADFDYFTTIGGVSTPGVFAFADMSRPATGETITAWAWDFGDGSGTDTVPDPEYTYADNGTYLVTLEVTDSGANVDSESRLVKVTGL